MNRLVERIFFGLTISKHLKITHLRITLNTIFMETLYIVTSLECLMFAESAQCLKNYVYINIIRLDNYSSHVR